MTKKQEEAIEDLERISKYGLRCIVTEEHQETIETVLNLIQEQQAEIEKKNKIINEMAETIMIDTAKIGTFWCSGCTEIARCKHNNNAVECIKQYFERKIEE